VTIYAAYGSNLDPNQMLLRAPYSPAQGTGWLAGWRLTFGGHDDSWGGALATVVEDAAHQVFVMLYDVPDSDERQLDSWELADLKLFRKIRVRVSTLDGDVTAWLYVLDDYEGGMPSARYLGFIAEAADAAGAPSDYVSTLRQRPSQ
jgi:hypothetical protein